MVMGSIQQETDVVVVGAGPGGYVAAIRAADLGHEVILVERRPKRGGVCLLEGCIPSKALISTIEVMHAAQAAATMGLHFEKLRIDTEQLRSFTSKVVSGLSRGIDGLLKQRGVEVLQGTARLSGPNELVLHNSDVSSVRFRHCIMATGSSPTLPGPWRDMDLWTSTEALALSRIPQTMLVIGGGYIGLELGLVYAGLGCQVSVVELLPSLLSGADADLVKPVAKVCQKRFAAVHTATRVEKISGSPGKFRVTLEGKQGARQEEYDQILVSVGRTPNTKDIGLDRIGIQPDKHGLIAVDERMRTQVPSIFTIGDIVPGPGLAHKASREGKVAAEVIHGKPSALDNVAIPAVVFTEPEIAWTGLTEDEAKQRGIAVKVSRFPLTALGRAKTMNRSDGMAKIITDPDSERVLGVGLVGPHASELIAEATLALEMGAVIEDLTATIHPHPTLSEALMEAAEVAEGLPVHTAAPRKSG